MHAPTRTAALIRSPLRARRVRNDRKALILALPLTGLTMLIEAALWPLYTGQLPERLLCLAIRMLAALTLPHTLLDTWLTQREHDIVAGQDHAGRNQRRVSRLLGIRIDGDCLTH